MNLSLQDPSVLARDLPESLLDGLKSGHSTVIRFSHRGDLLASGRLDGTVVIFDCDTSSVARKLRGHTRQVQSLCWSADDRYILSSSQDWRTFLWDLQTGERLRIVRFEAPIFIAEFHPVDHLRFVVALFEDVPIIVDAREAEAIKKPLPTIPLPRRIEADAEKYAAQDAKQTTTIATFTPDGRYIFTGTNKGWLNIIDTETRQTLASQKIASSILILIRFTASGKNVVINSADRVIRTYRLPDFTHESFSFDNFHIDPEHRFQEVVTKLSWNHVCWSPSNEYVCASSFMNHAIYIWERGQGSLLKILDTPEEISVVDWHPHNPCIAAVGVEEGRIYMWSVPNAQRWSALAPDFVELEENDEYVEKEDEFDIQPPEELHKRRLDLEDEDVDVLTMDPVKTSQFQVGDFIMPVIMDLDGSDSEDEVVAVGAGQFRRKTPGQDWLATDSEAVASGDESRRATSNGQARMNGNKRRRND